MTMFERRKALFSGKTDAPIPVENINPLSDPKITVIESNIDGDPKLDWMVIRSPYFLGEKVVTEYAAEKSGLETWWVVSSYPHCVGTYYEWRLRR